MHKPPATSNLFSSALHEHQKLPQEIERKFLLQLQPKQTRKFGQINELPYGIKEYPHQYIHQGYIAIDQTGTEVRLRQMGDEFFQTVKIGTGKTRLESEIQITRAQFEALWHTTQGKRVEKTRYSIPYEGVTIELDVYSGVLKGLMTAEIEFTDIQSSQIFEPPAWIGIEVTYDARFKNQALAIAGIPDVTEENIKKIVEYNLEEGVQKLAAQIRDLLNNSTNNIIIQIAGGSASGKTSAVANKLAAEFGSEAYIFSADDYYRGKKFMDSEVEAGRELNWDQPEALDLRLYREHLEVLKAGDSIKKPIYDMKTSERIGTEEVHPKRITIAEGLFTLDDSLKDVGEIQVFVNIGTHGRVIRRLLRDIARTGQKPSDILQYFAQVVEPMHEKYIESTKKNAGVIIHNEYCPEIEAQRSGLHEVQLKFAGSLDTEVIRKLGAEKLGSTHQVDKYYDPKDRNLIESDEMLRIRDEAGKKTLTYKGPQVTSQFREKPKFEFEIDEKTEHGFLSIYGKMIKTIIKDRELYILDGIIFSLDRVKKQQGEEEIFLGEFIEIRSTNKNADQARIESVLKKLGLDINQGIKVSYFEM